MDSRGFEANFAGYLGRLLAAGVKIDGTLVDSWECGCQTWTWKMEEEFEKRAGYALKPWLPALFGYVLKSEAETEKFLLDWRNVCSRLIEENYYGTIARLARENGMSVQYETAFGDVIPGDPLRFWKYADEPMCEFWSPHRNEGSVGSFDFKPVIPCVSAAHLYGRRRVSAEALTSFDLTFDENFRDWKKIVDEHFARGVTHIVFHTYTHNPVVGGRPPSTSFGAGIGSPFLRDQTWWPYMKHFSKYIERCGTELERGLPVVDILMYLGDDVNHRPSERELLFGNRYKYDYLNNDVLMNALDVADGRLVVSSYPAGSSQTGRMSYRVLWIPAGTHLIPSSERRLAELAAKGARVVYGELVPDWPSPLAALGLDADGLVGWQQRHDDACDIFFLVDNSEHAYFLYVSDTDSCASSHPMFDPVTGLRSDFEGSEYAGEMRDRLKMVSLDFKPSDDYPAWATKRVYEAMVKIPSDAWKCRLDLGAVRDWATVFVDGRKVADLWCNPYSCDLTRHITQGGSAAIRVEVVSTWYNALVHDAALPEREQKTWTINGPNKSAKYHPAGLLGPAKIDVVTRSSACVRSSY